MKIQKKNNLGGGGRVPGVGGRVRGVRVDVKEELKFFLFFFFCFFGGGVGVRSLGGQGGCD